MRILSTKLNKTTVSPPSTLRVYSRNLYLTKSYDTVAFGAASRYIRRENLEIDDFHGGEFIDTAGWVKASYSADIGSIKAGGDVWATEVSVSNGVTSDGGFVEFTNSDCAGEIRAAKHVKAAGCSSIGAITGSEVTVSDSTIQGDVTATKGDIDFRYSTAKGVLQAKGAVETNAAEIGSIRADSSVTLRDTAVTQNVSTGANAQLNSSKVLGLISASSGSVTINGSDETGSILAKSDIALSDVNVQQDVTSTDGNITSTNSLISGKVTSPQGQAKLTQSNNIGSVDARDVILDNVVVEGPVRAAETLSVLDSLVKGPIDFEGGTLEISNSTIEGDITVGLPPTPLEGSLANLPGAVSFPKAVTLKAGSVVNGDITFQNGEGMVLLEAGAEFNGTLHRGRISRL